MNRVLYISSSLFEDQGASSQLGARFLGELQRRHPGATVTTLDLAAMPMPHLGSEEFSSWGIPAAERSLVQQKQAALSDRLIRQLLEHDILVLAVPMYNLGIPSTLKAWFDRVVRAGKTFKYGPSGPEGLVKNMRAYLLFARGGQYRDTPLDTQSPYLNGILGLIGIRDIETVYAENLARGGDARAAALSNARREISRLVGATVPEVNYASA